MDSLLLLTSHSHESQISDATCFVICSTNTGQGPYLSTSRIFLQSMPNAAEVSSHHFNMYPLDGKCVAFIAGCLTGNPAAHAWYLHFVLMSLRNFSGRGTGRCQYESCASDMHYNYPYMMRKSKLSQAGSLYRLSTFVGI